MEGKFKTLKSFNYGSVSNPKKLTAGNIMSAEKFSEKQINQWLKLGWIEMI